MDEIIARLRSFADAYPESIFPPFDEHELRAYSAVISRASAGMGRHFAKVFKEIADDIERLQSNGS